MPKNAEVGARPYKNRNALRDPLKALSAKQREGLDYLAAGGSLSSAAAIMGVDESTIRHQLNGRDRGIYREAFQALMVQEGITPKFVAEGIKDSLNATKWIYDRKTDVMIEVPDHTARGRAQDLAVKLFDLKPPQELSKMNDAGASGLTVIIETNIGEGKAEAVNPAYEVEAKVVGE